MPPSSETQKSSPVRGGGPAKPVEGCHPIETATPLRRGYALPPPLPWQGRAIVNGAHAIFFVMLNLFQHPSCPKNGGSW